MEFRNYTPFVPMVFENIDVNDNPFKIVILKGTFKIVKDAPLKPIPDQHPLVLTDEFYGEMNESSIRFESDLVPYKPNSDIIVNAIAHSPEKRPVPQWMVSVQVGELKKELLVMGKRFWKRMGMMWKLTKAEPCLQVPIKYENAYGGQWQDNDQLDVFEENPVGCGYVNKKFLKNVEQIPAPDIMNKEDPVTVFNQLYKPQGFSTISKSWTQRRQYTGTYDDKWIKERHPYLPKDFDFAYYNCSHPDMIYNGYLTGNETVELKNLHPEHKKLQFGLPDYKVFLLLRYLNGSMKVCKVSLDTLHIELPEEQAYLVWRGQFDIGEPLRVIEARMIIPESTENRKKNG